MKKMIKGTVFVCCLALAACGSDNNDDNNGMSNNGMSNNGMSNNSMSNNGMSNNGMSTGGLTTGADCKPSDTCTDGYCMVTDPAADMCVGTCAAWLAIGDMCAAGEGVCDFTTSVCDAAGTKVCTAKAAKDAECFSGQCETGLYCEKAMAGDMTGTCADLIAVDQPCPAFFGCEADLYCDATDPAAPVCKAKTIDKDGDCDATTAAQCKSPYYCDLADTNTCIEAVAPTCD